MIKNPTLLINGDSGYVYQELDHATKLISKCRPQVIKNQQWFPGMENHEEFAAAILDFFRNPGV